MAADSMAMVSAVKAVFLGLRPEKITRITVIETVRETAITGRILKTVRAVLTVVTAVALTEVLAVQDQALETEPADLAEERLFLLALVLVEHLLLLQFLNRNLRVKKLLKAKNRYTTTEKIKKNFLMKRNFTRKSRQRRQVLCLNQLI